MVVTNQRPAEVDDRAVPGHREGKVIIGSTEASVSLDQPQDNVFGELAREQADLDTQHARRNIENPLALGVADGQTAARARRPDRPAS